MTKRHGDTQRTNAYSAASQFASVGHIEHDQLLFFRGETHSVKVVSRNEFPFVASVYGGKNKKNTDHFPEVFPLNFPGKSYLRVECKRKSDLKCIAVVWVACLKY